MFEDSHSKASLNVRQRKLVDVMNFLLTQYRRKSRFEGWKYFSFISIENLILLQFRFSFGMVQKSDFNSFKS